MKSELEIAKYHGLTQADLDLAIQIRHQQPVPEFTEHEQKILLRFFSNVDKNTFFIFGMPEEVVSVLMAMYSRLQNDRGIRGVFLDLIQEVPLVGELFTANPEELIRKYEDTRLLDHKFLEQLAQFMGMGFDQDHYREAVTAERITKFLSTWLDKFGHNSIARTAVVHFGCEQISVIAAKALEWTRPAAGYIELSTRYVRMDKSGLYPIWRYFQDDLREDVYSVISEAFDTYCRNLDSCETYWTKLWPEQCQRKDPDKPSLAVAGKQGDSLGNLLSCAILTSVGISVSGESLPGVIKHLYQDGTAECIALAIEIQEELQNLGTNIFLRHQHPTEYDLLTGTIDLASFATRIPKTTDRGGIIPIYIPDAKTAFKAIIAFEGIHGQDRAELYLKMIEQRFRDLDSPTESHAKLPRGFEAVNVSFQGKMSFRTWRELQRHGLCSHRRSLVRPGLGYYTPPDMPDSYHQDAERLFERCSTLWMRLRDDLGYPAPMLQYIMPMGTFIQYSLAMNLRQAEFLMDQRTGRNAHHEVRRHALMIDDELRRAYPWWEGISRTNRTEDYIFARGNVEIPALADRD